MDAVVSNIRERISDFNVSSKQNRPFVTLTYAQSLDGSISAERGSPLLLSGKESMTMTHALRAAHDAILVGVGTLIADDPSLNVRHVNGTNPRPIILDSSLRMPLNRKLFTSSTCVRPIIATVGSYVHRPKVLSSLDTCPQSALPLL
mmetsp:Transcript_34521/g.55844  ORF Transcript_34521/g.55844 Transcript_34521/m.55844 type:complete len:147 (+) Transcript_34521:57-497(+)